MSPLPNHRVIPAGWAEHHRPTATGTMTVPCIIKRSVGAPPYPLPENWTGTDTIHETVCRVQELKREGNAVPADQPTALREYLVPVPLVNAAGEDLPDLRVGEQGDLVYAAGRELRVTNIMFGSLEWERDLICVDNLTQQNP